MRVFSLTLPPEKELIAELDDGFESSGLEDASTNDGCFLRHKLTRPTRIDAHWIVNKDITMPARMDSPKIVAENRLYPGTFLSTSFISYLKNGCCYLIQDYARFIHTAIHVKDSSIHIIGSDMTPMVGMTTHRRTDMKFFHSFENLILPLQPYLTPTPAHFQEYEEICVGIDEHIEKYGLPELRPKDSFHVQVAMIIRYRVLCGILALGINVYNVAQVLKYLKRCTNVRVFLHPEFGQVRLNRLATTYAHRSGNDKEESS